MKTSKWTPVQALTQLLNDEEIAVCAVIYRRKGEFSPRVTCSSMNPMEVYFFGGALQEFAWGRMTE
jgi:hypothetical protein